MRIECRKVLGKISAVYIHDICIPSVISRVHRGYHIGAGAIRSIGLTKHIGLEARPQLCALANRLADYTSCFRP